MTLVELTYNQVVKGKIVGLLGLLHWYWAGIFWGFWYKWLQVPTEHGPMKIDGNMNNS